MQPSLRKPALRSPSIVFAAVATIVTVACSGGGGSTPTAASDEPVVRTARSAVKPQSNKPVSCELFAPGDGDQVMGTGGWFVDLDCEFPGNLKSTGFTGNQLTGPGVHNNVAPFPGTFAPGKDDRFGGLIVLISTTTGGAKSCQNLANLFNLTGPTNLADDGTEIWDTWIIGAAGFGRNTRSRIWIAEASDLNHDGIYNDAPDVVPDANNDGHCDARDLAAFGLDSDVVTAQFIIH